MSKHRIKLIYSALFICLLMFTAFTCRLAFAWNSPYAQPLAYLRSAIYILIFTIWAFSIQQRIIQVQTRRYLLSVAGLMIFWLAVRTVKYDMVSDPFIKHWLWYLYYIPLIFIPLFSLFVAQSICRSENYHSSRVLRLLYAPAGILLLLVLTNDLHHFVFVFPPDSSLYCEGSYSYGLGYSLIVGWIVVCIISTVYSLFARSRMTDKMRRILLPTAILLLMGLYAVCYSLRLPIIFEYINDCTTTYCLCLVAFFNSLFLLGLIQNNTHYGDLFRITSIPVDIADQDYRVLLSSSAAHSISEETMRRTADAPVLLDGGLRLSGAPIKNGHVLWIEDVSELAELLEELAESRENIMEETNLLRENYNTELRIRHLAEKNRLYDELHRQTAPQIQQLETLIHQLQTTKDEAQRKLLLQTLVILGVYLKRRTNLALLSEQNPMLHVRELSLCFEEMMSNLTLCGISCGYYTAIEHSIPAAEAIALFDFYEQVIEAAHTSLRAVLVRLLERGDCLVLSVTVSCGADLSALQSGTVSVSRDEEGQTNIVLRFPTGGAAE